MSKAIIGMSVAFVLFRGISAESLQTPTSPELKVLGRLAGDWRIVGVSRQGDLGESKFTEFGVTKWSLQGRYVEQRVTDSDGKREVALSLSGPTIRRQRSTRRGVSLR